MSAKKPFEPEKLALKIANLSAGMVGLFAVVGLTITGITGTALVAAAAATAVAWIFGYGIGFSAAHADRPKRRGSVSRLFLAPVPRSPKPAF